MKMNETSMMLGMAIGLAIEVFQYEALLGNIANRHADRIEKLQAQLRTEQAVCQRGETEIFEILGDDDACPSPYDACQPLIDIYLAACTPHKDLRNLKP